MNSFVALICWAILLPCSFSQLSYQGQDFSAACSIDNGKSTISGSCSSLFDGDKISGWQTPNNTIARVTLNFVSYTILHSLHLYIGGSATVNFSLSNYERNNTNFKLPLVNNGIVQGSGLQLSLNNTIYVNQVNLVLKSTVTMNWRSLDMNKTIPTKAPTLSPTRTPTRSPTPVPTRSPTLIPTPAPTYSPTPYPTSSPTFGIVKGRTPEAFGTVPATSVKWSLNIYPLSQRHDCHNTTCTYSNYQPDPPTQAYCLTCILAWNDIDGKLTIQGCPLNFTRTNSHELLPSPFYFCDTGTYVLESTGRLASFQKTYLAFEIWEYDQNHQKYQQFYQEFQWNKSLCTWDNDGTVEPCEYLPLTGTNENTARIVFTMAKQKYDSRQNPLLIVWYDILGIPYGVRPSLLFEYKNITLLEIKSGNPFSFSDLLTTGAFRIPFYSMVALVIMFVILSIAGIMKGKKGRAITKADYIIDTRNLRSVFQNLPENLVVEEKMLKSRSKFKFYKHGPYLCVVLLGRLAYMFVFTLTFFYVVFQSINKQHFEVLSQYNNFAQNRDNQLWNFSAEIETYYNNETQRMSDEATFRRYWCYDVWILRVSAAYANKTALRFAYDSFQMQEPLRRIKGLNLTGADSMYVAGSTACDANPVNGARQLYYDELCIYANLSSNETCYEAKYYNRTWANFSVLQSVLIDTCLHTSDCVGWTWIDATSSDSQGHFAVFSAFSTPQFTNDTSGVCYLIARYSASTFSMSTVEDLAGINTELDSQYLESYETSVSNLYTTLQGLYASLKALNGYRSDNFNVSVKVIADPTAKGVYTKVVQKSVSGVIEDDRVAIFMVMEIQIICPYCPQGNFSQPVLQKAFDYVLNHTYFNLSDLGNHTGEYNFSDVVSVNTGLVKIPAIPSISLPLDINFPHIGLPIYWFLGFDTLLTIYRWYKTAGILANVIRGKDVEIELRHLMVRSKEAFCCPSTENIGDRVLSTVIYCSGYCSNVTYTCWKLFYWIWLLVQLLILLSFLLLMYFLIDQIINVNFIKQLQIFPLLTSGLAAQRSVRNSVICTTALTYNNYTLNNMKLSRIQYAIQKNIQIVQWNRGELQRVNGYNSYFCAAWGQYMGTVRDITQDGYPLIYNGSSNMGTVAKQTFNNLFDHLDNTTWQPYTPSEAKALRQSGKKRTVTIDIQFPLLQLTWTPHPNHTTYWRIDHVDLSWGFNKSNSQGYNSTYGSVSYTFFVKQNGSDTFEAQTTSSNKYSATDYDKTEDVQSVYLYGAANETKYLRINFSSAETWADAFRLNGITVYGKIAKHNIKCPFVIYAPIVFDASSPDYNPEFCPGVQPIFGVMYRHFVRSWLDDELWEGHVPFILAVRAICLSPFYILVIAVGGLICGYLVAFMVEWILSSVDLLRENPYAPVPLVYSREHYDKQRHEPRAFKDATIAHDYYRPDLKEMMKDEEEHATSMSHDLHEKKVGADGGYTGVELQTSYPQKQQNIETITETYKPISPKPEIEAEVQTTQASQAPRDFGLPPRAPPKIPVRQPSAEIDYPMDDIAANMTDETTAAGETFDYDEA